MMGCVSDQFFSGYMMLQICPCTFADSASCLTSDVRLRAALQRTPAVLLGQA